MAKEASISLEALADKGDVPSEQAVSLGLIVTELVINALKHAFPPGVEKGRVVVRYEVADKGWTLSVSDNGVGIKPKPDKMRKGLGVTLVTALSQQLEAKVETKSDSKGTSVSIIRDLKTPE